MKLVAVEQIDPRIDDVVRVEWNVGRRCNYDCSYCGIDLHDNFSRHKSYNEMVRMVDKIVLAYPGKQIRFGLTGGEPFVNPHMMKVLRYMKESSIDRISVTTNGSLPDRLYVESCEYVNNLIISYHPERADMTKLRNNILQIQSRQREIMKHDPMDHRYLSIHVMMLPGHFDQILEFVDWLQQHGVPYVKRRIRPMYNKDGGFNLPYSSGMEGEHEYINRKEGPNDAAANGYYSEEELAILGQGEKKKAATYHDARVHILTENEIVQEDTNVNKLLMDRNNGFKGWTCWAGLQTLQISPDGDIYRGSCRVGHSIGNISEDFDLPTDPIICTKKWCNCASDLNTTKHAEGYFDVTRLKK